MKAIRDMLKRVDSYLLSRFPEEWVAVGSEGIASLTSSSLNVLFQFFLLSLFDPLTAGIYFAALGMAHIISLIADGGYGDIIGREIMERKGLFPSFVRVYVFSTTISSTLSGIIFNKWSIAPFLAATLFAGAITTAYHRMGEYAKKHVISFSFSIAKVALLLIASYLSADPYPLLALTAVVYLPYIKYLSPKAWKEDLRKALANVKEGLRVRTAALYGSLVGMGDSSAIHFLFPKEYVALYNAAVFIPKKLSLILGRLSLAPLPVLVRKGKSLKALFAGVILFLLIGVVLYFFGEPLYIFLFPTYKEGVHLFRLASLLIPLVLFGWAVYGYLYAKRRYKEIAVASLSASALIVGGWYALSSIGLEGILYPLVMAQIPFAIVLWKVRWKNGKR